MFKLVSLFGGYMLELRGSWLWASRPTSRMSEHIRSYLCASSSARIILEPRGSLLCAFKPIRILLGPRGSWLCTIRPIRRMVETSSRRWDDGFLPIGPLRC